MPLIHDMGRSPHGLYYFMVQDASGEPRAFLGSPEQIAELARDLLDLVGKEYCLPYVCDHLEVRERAS